MQCALYVVCMAEMEFFLVTPMVYYGYQHFFRWFYLHSTYHCIQLQALPLAVHILFTQCLNQCIADHFALSVSEHEAFQEHCTYFSLLLIPKYNKNIILLFSCVFPVSSYCIVNGLFDTWIFVTISLLQ